MKAKGEKISTNAKLIKKNQQTFEDLASGKGIPIPKELYELVFETKDGTISFTVSEYEYHVVNEKDEAQLTYIPHKHHNELISFGDKIKEFTM